MLRTFGRGSKFWADYWQNVESGSSGSFPCLHHWCRWENHNASLFHSPDILLRYWLCFHRQRMSHQTDRAIYLQEVCGWAELMSLLSQNRAWATVAVLNIYMVSKTLSLKAYNLYNDHHCCLKTLFFDGQYNHNKVLLPWWPSIPTWHIFTNRAQASPGALCSLCEEALPFCEERELRDERSLQTHSHHLYNGTTRSSLLGRLHFIWRMKICCLWCLERMLCWAHPGLMASGRAQGNWLGLGMVRGTVKLVKKNASISTQSASCVYVCWITNCLLSQHRSSESVLWSFVWVVDTVVTYRASVAVINLSSGEFHSLCSFSKTEICVSPSLLDQTIHSVESLGLIFFSLKPEFVIWV